MNPSASGWIPKYLTIVDKQHITENINDIFFYYKKLKTTGFLYGTSTEALTNKPLSKLNITRDEYTKINLFQSLLFIFFTNKPNAEINDAITSIIAFYKELDKGKTSFFYKFSVSKSPSDNLEHILSSRLQETNSLFNKNSNNIFTYTLLFLDILTYRKFLNSKNDCKKYMQKLESDLINYSFLALESKKEKDKIDLQILDQLESSTAYLTLQNQQNQFLNLQDLNPSSYDELEKNYVLDICFLAIWNDKVLDASEYSFLLELVKSLQLPEERIKENISVIKEFSEKHSKSIKLFESSNPLNQLYKQSSATVKLLIIRNKNRLIEELAESGELVILLGQSTIRELSSDEKDKVKEQLLDICKSVPSLTIFLIPGGSLLLPLLVKYIPSLLPSSFNDNKIDTKNK
ncbi:MAG: hypothetical protein ACI93N_001844 [Flavobacteriaceae bacterium]|jgi:hypothetical protein